MRKHNEPTLAELGGARFEQMRTEALEVLDTDAPIPYVRRRGEYLYNFWRDAANPRGLWRRTTLESYRTDEPDWDVLLDVDALAAAEDENWVWDGADVLEPDHSTLALINLSRGGATPPWCASSTWHKDNSSPTDSRCPRRRRRSAGTTRTPSGRHRLRRRTR